MTKLIKLSPELPSPTRKNKENPYLLPNNPSEETINNWEDFWERSALDEGEMLARVRIQSDEGYLFVASKRDELQVDYQLFLNQKRDAEAGMLGDTTIYNDHCARMAREIEEDPTATFQTLDIGQVDVVRNLNAAYKEDHESQNLQVIKYYAMWFKNLFGVGILARMGWDGSSKENVYQYVDPRIWIPDPNGNYATGNYSYCGFDTLRSYSDVKSMRLMNADRLVPQQLTFRSESQLKYKDQGTSGLNRRTTNPAENPWYDLYWHFCPVPCKDGKTRWGKFLMGINRGIFLSAEFLPEVTPEDKENPENIRPPFSFYHFKPLPNDPFGDRPANKLRDVQITKAMLANLRVAKAKAELYPMYFFNKKYINGQNLSFGFNKFIPIDTGMDGNIAIDNIVKPFRPDARADWSLTIDETLDRQSERSTSISPITMGAVPQSRRTATENGIQQNNTDVNLALSATIDTWGEKNFVRDWLRGYLENFESGDTKLVILNTGIANIPTALKKKDFLIGMLVKITVKSKTLTQAEQNKERLALSNIAALALSSSIPEISKRMLLRDLAIASGYPEEKIASRFPKTPQEMLSEQENGVLSYKMDVSINPDDDHLTHLIVHKGAVENESTQKHIQAHIDAYIKS